MKRSWNVLSVALVALFLVAAAAPAQETILGFFEGPIHGDTAGSGVIYVTGWGLADSGVRRVEILVDGVVVGQAMYGRTRPDVQNVHPGFVDSAEAGFAYNWNTTDHSNGVHTITARVVSDNGNTLLLNSREVFTTNNSAILPPFGRINRPQRNATLWGSCEEVNPIKWTVIEGWALDLGVEIGDAGVGYVELMIDGSIITNTRIGCFYNMSFGGLTNCYGLFRPDVERAFPFAIDAPNAGFRFVIDIGELIRDFGFAQGHHTLTIRAGDIITNVANIHEFPVFFQCQENRTNEPSFGRIESPRLRRQYGGIIELRGWALDWEGVSEVQLFIDGEFIGVADYGVDSRPFVLTNYPGYPDSDLPVWSKLYDTTELSDGFHQFQVIVRDLNGKRKIIGESTFNVNNEPGGSNPVDE